MTRIISLENAPENLVRCVSELAEAGDSLILTQDGRPIAELRKLFQRRPLSDLAKIMADAPHLSPEDADAFANDIGQIQKEMNQGRAFDPWAF